MMKEAEKLDSASSEFEVKSEAQIPQHHRWAQTTTARKIAIAMACNRFSDEATLVWKGIFIVSGVGLMVGLLAHMYG